MPPGSLPELMSELRELLYHRNFIALALSSNFVIQMVYTCVIIMGPLLQPCGISPATTGVALAGFSVGSALSPLGYLYSIRGVTPSYFDLQRGWTLLCSLGLVIILAVHRRGESPTVAVTAWSTLGVLSGVLGNSGLTLEHAAEMTFPRPPNVSLTLLTITGACASGAHSAIMTPSLSLGNLISCVQVLVATAIVNKPGLMACSMVLSPITWYVGSSCVASIALLALLRPEYRRAELRVDQEGTSTARAADRYGATEL
jgi:hypothetical protein